MASRRFKENTEKLDSSKVYGVKDAMQTLKGLRPAKFDETVEVVARLGVDPKKSDQTYAKAGIGLSVIAILAGAAFTFVISGKGAYANSARAAVAGVTPASQTLIAQ